MHFFNGRLHQNPSNKVVRCTEIYFASFFSGGSITAIVINQPMRGAILNISNRSFSLDIEEVLYSLD